MAAMWSLADPLPDASVVSAFPESGRFYPDETPIFRVRFRLKSSPQASEPFRTELKYHRAPITSETITTNPAIRIRGKTNCGS